MVGETKLVALLSGLQPSLSAIEFGFASLPLHAPTPVGVEPICTFRETEGQTLIAPLFQLASAGIECSSSWAQITLAIHTSLEAVGLMAAVATTLAEAGISTNPIAGYFHDHLFVPWQRRHDAMNALLRLSGSEGDEQMPQLTTATLAVRRACLRDIDAIAPLFDAYRVFYQQPPDSALSRAFIAERLAARDSEIFIAEQNGEAIGFTQLYQSFSSVRAKRIYILNDLYVTLKARRSGAARALLNAAAIFARQQGAVTLTLSTARTNTAAHTLYETAGWIHDQQFRSYNLALS